MAAQLSLCLGELTAHCLGPTFAAGWSDVCTSDVARKDSSCLVTGAHILQVTEAHPTAHCCPIPLEPDTSDMCHSSLRFSIRTTPVFIISFAFLLSYCYGEFGDRGQIWDRNVGLGCHLLRFPSWPLSNVYLKSSSFPLADELRCGPRTG